MDKEEMLRQLTSGPLTITPAVRAGIPKELQNEICLYSSLNIEDKIIKTIAKTPNKMMALNNIIVVLYVLTGEVVTREQVAGKVWRMVNKGELIRVEGRRGVYALPRRDKSHA